MPRSLVLDMYSLWVVMALLLLHQLLQWLTSACLDDNWIINQVNVLPAEYDLGFELFFISQVFLSVQWIGNLHWMEFVTTVHIKAYWMIELSFVSTQVLVKDPIFLLFLKKNSTFSSRAYLSKFFFKRGTAWMCLHPISWLAIIFIISWDFLMFYQISLSPELKRSAIISNKHGIYELPNELPNDFRLSILRN